MMCSAISSGASDAWRVNEPDCARRSADRAQIETYLHVPTHKVGVIDTKVPRGKKREASSGLGRRFRREIEREGKVAP